MSTIKSAQQSDPPPIEPKPIARVIVRPVKVEPAPVERIVVTKVFYEKTPVQRFIVRPVKSEPAPIQRAIVRPVMTAAITPQMNPQSCGDYVTLESIAGIIKRDKSNVLRNLRRWESEAGNKLQTKRAPSSGQHRVVLSHQDAKNFLTWWQTQFM